MTKDFLTKKETIQFIGSARRYCEFIESNLETDSIAFLKNVRVLLLTLYQNGLYFPLYNGECDEDEADLLGDHYFKILELISQKVGETDFYFHVYDPTILSNETPVGGSLSDDLGDIYRDLKRALLKLDTGSEAAKEDALWSLHFLFGAHYSEHIINGLYAIHFFLRDKYF